MGVPEKPTLVEQFVQLIPLKYTYAALIWTSVLFTPGYPILNYLVNGPTAFSLLTANPYNVFFATLAPFYLFIIARYLRLKVVNSEPQIAPIMTIGEEAYHSAFGRISNKPPVILMTAFFSVIIIAQVNYGPNPHLPPLVLNLIQNVVINLGVAQLIWEYSVSSWGLHRLGQSQLKLKSFLEDRMMGSKPFGNVALSSTLAYFGGILISFLLLTSSLPVNGGTVVAIVVFLALGIVMFFLPLNSVHKKMQAEKAGYQKTLGLQLLARKQAGQAQTNDSPASIEKVEKSIAELVQLKDLEITERKLASTPTWPFDVQLLGKLITIILSVTAVLLSRIITSFLHI